MQDECDHHISPLRPQACPSKASAFKFHSLANSLLNDSVVHEVSRASSQCWTSSVRSFTSPCRATGHRWQSANSTTISTLLGGCRETPAHTQYRSLWPADMKQIMLQGIWCTIIMPMFSSPCRESDHLECCLSLLGRLIPRSGNTRAPTKNALPLIALVLVSQNSCVHN